MKEKQELPERQKALSTQTTLPIITIPTGDIVITKDLIQDIPGQKNNSHLRPFIVRQLIAHEYDKFVTHPYASGDNIITSRSMGSGYEATEDIVHTDDLDTWLENIGTGRTDDDALMINEETRSTRSGLYLFKNTYDLQTMGYEVISHRQRVSKDKDYRRFNIAQSFKLMGNVRVILPGEQFEFLEYAQYDEYEQKNYVEGYAIIDGEEEKDYAGGICGASTAVYQGILTNQGLSVNKQRAHSKRFSDLYTAQINHQDISTPGIDSAVYQGQLDLWIENITPHPIVLVMNYDGSYEGIEEVFTLSMPTLQGDFEFISGGKRRRTEEVENPEGTGKITQTVNAGGCYTRIINGEEKVSCYKEVW